MKLVVSKSNSEHVKDRIEQERIEEIIQHELNELVERILGILDVNQLAIPECTNDDILNVMCYAISIWTVKTFTEQESGLEMPPRNCIWSSLKMMEYHLTSAFVDAIGYDQLKDF